MRRCVSILLTLWILSSPAFARIRRYDPEVYTFFEFKDFPLGEVAFINGINHRPQRAIKCSALLADMAGGYNVFTIYNPTDGLFGDLKKCYHELYRFKVSAPVLKLQEKWDSFFVDAEPHELFMQFCHSQGAIQVRNALLHYPPELRKRIIVIAIAPAAYISDNICHHAIHYVSRRDIVPHIDKHGKKRCKESTVILTPHPKAALFDHHFLSPTYRAAIEHHLKDYLKRYAGQDD